MTPFAVTWDYRCPFARLAHLHLLDGLAAGADWDITFLPFSLGQVHVAEGEAPIWERPDDDSGLLTAGHPARKVPIYALAIVVSSSRIHTRMHHASDVVAGAAIGIGIARAARRWWPAP